MKCAWVPFLFLCACATGGPHAPAIGELLARPRVLPVQCAPGERTAAGALLYVPPRVAPKAPLLLLLHGAGSEPSRILGRLRPLADEHGIIVVAPKSAGLTWDGILGTPGPDVRSIDASLAAVFEQCSIDRRHVGVGGFSDGASYALTLGIANGDLFTHVLAFSACIIAPQIVPRGSPRFFLSHGRQDRIMPIDDCGSRIAQQLRQANDRVLFEEFSGGHELPEKIARQAFDWFAR